MASTKTDSPVRWAELLPDAFLARQQQCPLVYLPMGLCEPHGAGAAFGLDTIKADYICDAAARQVGGIVAPTQGYHIHETGYHAPWLKEVIGEVNPRMASVPPDVLLRLFLYQLRAFANAGFRGAVVITGHAGGNQEDLRRVATVFMRHFPMRIEVRADPELVAGQYEGDHAGRYEISQLLHLRPDLVDTTKLNHPHVSLGRFALGDDAPEASPELGEKIMNACVEEACQLALRLQATLAPEASGSPISFAQTEALWREIDDQREHWATHRLHPNQSSTSAHSRWKVDERPG